MALEIKELQIKVNVTSGNLNKGGGGSQGGDTDGGVSIDDDTLERIVNQCVERVLRRTRRERER